MEPHTYAMLEIELAWQQDRVKESFKDMEGSLGAARICPKEYLTMFPCKAEFNRKVNAIQKVSGV